MKRKFNDPHVERLTYRVVHSDDVHYSKAPAIEIEKANFHAKLENEALSLTMKSHTSSEDEARSLVEPFLHAWEVHTGLLLAPDEIGFRYERAEVVDRAPSPEDKTVLFASASCIGVTTASARGKVVRGRCYPSPPDAFAVSPDVQSMYDRYKGYVDGREPLPSMAFFVVTMLKWKRGKKAQRKAAASHYNVAVGILRELENRCSTRGGPQEARKAPETECFQPLTAREREWMLAAVKRLIRRAGERELRAADQLTQITMADLPPLA